MQDAIASLSRYRLEQLSDKRYKAGTAICRDCYRPTSRTRPMSDNRCVPCRDVARASVHEKREARREARLAITQQMIGR